MSNPSPFKQEAESPPWNEKEMTELAVEIFQQRERVTGVPPLSASRLLFDNIFNDPAFVAQLNWEELRLPNKRSVAACKGTFNWFRNQRQRHGSISSNPPQSIAPSPMSFAPPILPSSSRKRPASVESGPASYGGQRLAPKPTTAAGFATGPNRLQVHPPSPLIEHPQPIGSEHPARKKRGRPSKKDVEERQARALRQLQERAAAPHLLQQSYGSPLMTIQPQFSQFPHQVAPPILREAPTETSAPQSPRIPDVTGTPRNTHQSEGDVNSSSSSSRKKRGRPPKVETDAMPQPALFASAMSSTGAYGSPPQSGVSIGSISRRLSISTRSQGTTAGPVQQEQGPQREEVAHQQNRQPRSWNDTVMGSSNNPNSRQHQP